MIHNTVSFLFIFTLICTCKILNYNTYIEKNYNTSSKLSLIALYSCMHTFFYIYHTSHELETNEKEK